MDCDNNETSVYSVVQMAVRIGPQDLEANPGEVAPMWPTEECGLASATISERSRTAVVLRTFRKQVSYQ